MTKNNTRIMKSLITTTKKNNPEGDDVRTAEVGSYELCYWHMGSMWWILQSHEQQ